MPALHKWPKGEDFTRTFCRTQRVRWMIHPHRIAERAGIQQHEFRQFEATKEPPMGLRLMVYAALRQLVCEHAIRAIVTLSDVEPYARKRVAYEVVAAEYRARHRRPPPPPQAANPHNLGWMETL